MDSEDVLRIMKDVHRAFQPLTIARLKNENEKEFPMHYVAHVQVEIYAKLALLKQCLSDKDKQEWKHWVSS